jgi:hypothetical protein
MRALAAAWRPPALDYSGGTLRRNATVDDEARSAPARTGIAIRRRRQWQSPPRAL